MTAGGRAVPAGASRHALAPALVCAIMLCAACENETTIINYRPMLGGLPGAESTTPVTRIRPPGADPTQVDEIRVEDPKTKKVTLHARTVRHLMVHVYQALMKDERDLFKDQILSEVTRQEFIDHNLDPGEAFTMLKQREQDVFKLFDAMPQGEYTPGLFLRAVGGGVQRLEITGPLARELEYTGIDAVMERGEYRLRWLVER